MKLVEIPVRRPRTLKDNAYFNHPLNAVKILKDRTDFRLLWNDKGFGVCELALPITLPCYTAVLLWLLPWFISIGIGLSVVFALVIAGLIFTAPELAIVGIQSWRNRRITRRTDQGYIVEGKVVQCTASDGRWFHPNLVVQTVYVFSTLTGQRCTGSLKETRNDLNGKQLPTPETPIYILYFSDDEFYLL